MDVNEMDPKKMVAFFYQLLQNLSSDGQAEFLKFWYSLIFQDTPRCRFYPAELFASDLVFVEKMQEQLSLGLEPAEYWIRVVLLDLYRFLLELGKIEQLVEKASEIASR